MSVASIVDQCHLARLRDSGGICVDILRNSPGWPKAPLPCLPGGRHRPDPALRPRPGKTLRLAGGVRTPAGTQSACRVDHRTGTIMRSTGRDRHGLCPGMPPRLKPAGHAIGRDTAHEAPGPDRHGRAGASTQASPDPAQRTHRLPSDRMAATRTFRPAGPSAIKRASPLRSHRSNARACVAANRKIDSPARPAADRRTGNRKRRNRRCRKSVVLPRILSAVWSVPGATCPPGRSLTPLDGVST